MKPGIFPGLRNRNWEEVNLNDIAVKLFPSDKYEKPTPGWIPKHLAERDSLLYGGFKEYRDWLHKGYYMDPANHLHLGVDYWVPVFTPVTVPVPCRVIHTDFSNDGKGDWGGVVFLMIHGDEFLMYGHLDPNTLPAIGTSLLPGQIVGLVGPREVNGNWTPHLHVQLFDNTLYQRYKEDLIKMDGYTKYLSFEGQHVTDPTYLVSEQRGVYYGFLSG